KTLDDDGLVEAARVFRAVADEFDALFILNDRPDLVEACDADGVHVGQADATPAVARLVVGPERIGGGPPAGPTPATRARGVRVDAEGDSMARGRVHATPTKPGRPAAGLDYVAWAAQHVRERPWFAI